MNKKATTSQSQQALCDQNVLLISGYSYFREGKLIIANAATSPWICIVTSVRFSKDLFSLLSMIDSFLSTITYKRLLRYYIVEGIGAPITGLLGRLVPLITGP